MTKKFGAIDSPQERQRSGWEKDVAALLEKHGADFASLGEKLRGEIAGQAREISRLSSAQSSFVERMSARVRAFEAISDRYAGSGYRGGFGSPEKAQAVGEWLLADARGDGPARERATEALERITGQHHAALDGSTGPQGGYVMQIVLLNEIITNLEKFGVCEREYDMFRTAGPGMSIPKRVGGLSVYHPELGAAVTPSDLDLGRITFHLSLYAVSQLVDMGMDEDVEHSLGAARLAEIIAQEIAHSLAHATDLYGLMGDGGATHARVVGLFKNESVNDVVATTGDNTFQEVIDANVGYLANVLGAVPTWVHQGGNAKWIGHLSIFAAYMSVRDTQERPLTNILTSTSGLSFYLMGYPFVLSSVTPALASTAASTAMLVFGDLRRAYGIARTLRGAQFIRDESIRVLNYQKAYVCFLRQDIQRLDENAYARLVTAAS